MCAGAGFIDGNFKNQSLRASTATRMFYGNQNEQLIQHFTGHTSLCVCRYKHPSDAIKRQASKIIQGAKRVMNASMSKLKLKNWKFKGKVTTNTVLKSPVKAHNNSDIDEFMASQNLRTFKGKPICDGGTTGNVTHGVASKSTSDAKCICDLIGEISKRKFKRIKFTVEIENATDSD